MRPQIIQDRPARGAADNQGAPSQQAQDDAAWADIVAHGVDWNALKPEPETVKVKSVPGLGPGRKT